MSDSDTIRLREILAEAMAKPAAQRAAFLAEACAGDDRLRGEVESLLGGLEREEEFLACPTRANADLPACGIPGLDASAVQSLLAEGPGSSIGRYKLHDLIGEGGFGSVFLARQEHPVRRDVALKVIKLGMDTKQVIARFEAERQALAMMDHPNIARVFDAGATDNGRPYFVMELVEGVPITHYCDDRKLSIRERLELFVQVCQAVQHAHTKGIIHRDLKPSNVLVASQDGMPVPKVIDFGIAKAVSSRLTEITLFTEYHQLIGTPAYMSPEQAEMSETDIDTRSDIYSLGVLLYELLTGSTPFNAEALRSKGYAEIQRVVREVEPPRPSTRLGTMGTTTDTIAASRGTDPRRLAQMLRGELDCIVLKALEKDRTRRYETAAALALDVQRYLNDEPVLARPPSRAYRFRKLVQRNRLAFGTAVALTLTLVGGLGLSTWSLALEAKARLRAIFAETQQTNLRWDAEQRAYAGDMNAI